MYSIHYISIVIMHIVHNIILMYNVHYISINGMHLVHNILLWCTTLIIDVLYIDYRDILSIIV